jgi:hypothetical protein
MRNVQLIKKYIRIIAKKKIDSHDMKQTDSLNNRSGMCVCLPQHPWLFSYFSRGHDRQSSEQNFSSRGYDRQSSEQNNQKLISLHNNGEDDKHAHRFADF